MSRFINDNVKLGKKKIKAKQISYEDMTKKIIEMALDDKEWKDYFLYNKCLEDFSEEELLEEVIESFLIPEVVELDCVANNENFTFSPYVSYGTNMNGTPLLGFQTLENGLTFLGIEQGGDWECPIFYIVYYDGENFCSHVPSYGNCVNLDFNCAFGSEGEYSCYMTKDEDTIIEEYKSLGIYDNNLNYSEMYCKKYDIDYETIAFNWKAIKEDILSTFEIE